MEVPASAAKGIVATSALSFADTLWRGSCADEAWLASAAKAENA